MEKHKDELKSFDMSAAAIKCFEKAEELAKKAEKKYADDEKKLEEFNNAGKNALKKCGDKIMR